VYLGGAPTIFLIRSDMTQITAHYQNVIHGYEGFLEA